MIIHIMLQIKKLNKFPTVHDCSCCPDKQRRFCQSQTFNDWKCDFATKDLSKFRNDNATEKFWRKTIECPTLPLSYDHD